MTLNLKKPQYIIPIILLPFICTLFYSYKSSFGKKEAAPSEPKDSLKTDVVGVSAQIKARNLSDKLDVLRENYKHTDGYSAINSIAEQDHAVFPEARTLSNDSEKHFLDSIGLAVGGRYGQGKTQLRNTPPSGSFPNATAFAASNNDNEQDRAFQAAIAGINNPAQHLNQKEHEVAPDPMQLFRQQMALIDSLSKAGDTETKASGGKKKLSMTAHSEPAEPKPLMVSKAATASPVFNTVRSDQKENPITAIVDQDITAYAGSRLRIRLLEDIWAGSTLIKSGSYLYAQVTGFSGQRINLSVTSILQAGNILPVKLELYDNDGLPGLYVPASAFRDFTKELGADATGVRLEQTAEGDDQQVISLLGKMFQSTTSAVGKLIRQNKAKLKYPTLIYLIDPAQRNYNKNQ